MLPNTPSTAELSAILSDSSASATQHSSGKSAEDATYTTVIFNKNAGSSSDAFTRAAFYKESGSRDNDAVKS